LILEVKVGGKHRESNEEEEEHRLTLLQRKILLWIRKEVYQLEELLVEI